ncbi:MAG: hypothetical protein HFG91_03185 [Acholeplasmatales bacterium]|jgi:hypothetical protein|nr:hypothetical protein [Acholeplasmatales bacterium]MCI9653338.1 hypothetical protein [Acholeplasmatales bacterium]
MRKKILALTLVLSMVLILVGCRTKIEDNGNKGKTELKINFATGNALKTLTYNTGTPVTLPDGSIYTNGQIKPAWNYIANHLDVAIKDVTVQGQTATNMIQIAAATNFEDAHIYGGNVAETFMEYGAKGKLINLLEYKDKLPDFMKYLEEYPLIKQQLTAYDGGIYSVPYVAELDEFSKVFYGRNNWIETLLDTDELLPETATLDVSYTGYWKGSKARKGANVVELQNQAASNGKLTGEVARQQLIQYIDTNYPNLEKRSDLYIDDTAEYDIDELVALWRVMKLYPNTLFKLTTGQSGTCEIVPFFFRTKNQRAEIFKLINYFGGTRVYGTNTYTGLWYVDESNTLQFSFYQDAVYEAFDYLKQIFSEGLINSDYDDTNNSADFRSIFYSSDLSVNSSGNSTVKQLGFMTFDFIPSTAASSPTGAVKAMLPPVTTLEGMHDNKFHHYIEIPRTVMIDGWAISANASGKELDKALELFNFFFTDFGSNVQNFGIPGVMADFDNLYTLPSGDKVPTLSKWLMEQAKIYTNGDVATFGQQFMGIRMPIGYKADIGFEYQNMTKEAQEGYDLYEEKGVLTLGYNKPSKLLELSAPCYSLTRQESARLATLSIGDDQINMIYLYIRSDKNSVSSVDLIKKAYESANILEYIDIYRSAYNRTKA